LTSPTATHAIAHSAYTANLKPKLGKHSFSKIRGGRS
jgi:multisubunit Na+/H+ antiporter MnhG subunit